MKKVSSYDSIVKQLFQRGRSSILLDRLTGGIPVRQILNVELTRVVERRADLVLLLADGTILHLEFQTRNDKDMALREGIYCLLLAQKYRCRRIRQAVIYLGEAKMRMPSELDLGQTKVTYTLIDIREMDAKTLMASGRPADLVLAMLARGGSEQLSEIVKQAAKLHGTERNKVLNELAHLAGLRRLQEPLIMELRSTMNPTDIFLEFPGVREKIRENSIDILRNLLKTKFRTVPKWAEEKLQSATSVQVQRWLKKVLTADTLEGVLGKR